MKFPNGKIRQFLASKTEHTKVSAAGSPPYFTADSSADLSADYLADSFAVLLVYLKSLLHLSWTFHF